jgi:hypothetical protein
MGYIPAAAKWYLATIVMEITVDGDARNVVHRNLTLVRADSPDEAFDKALALGKDAETEYTNRGDQLVRHRFRGLGELLVVYDEFEHGSELLFDQDINVSPEQIRSWIKSKDQLGVFQPIQPHEGPDYGSKEIMEEVLRRIEETDQ